jgi:hypothetical protein
MADTPEKAKEEEPELEDVDDGEVLPERIAMSLITPTGEEPLPELDPLRGPEEN